VAVEVFHDDRDIEFHQLLNYLEANVTTESLNHKSCEMIANDVAELVVDKHWNRERKIVVDVSEDGECGVTAEYSVGAIRYAREKAQLKVIVDEHV
jgi:hypothetical protein